MRPLFGFWLWRSGVTVVLFRRLFQVKFERDELPSQRLDTSRIRLCGLSVKLFG